MTNQVDLIGAGVMGFAICSRLFETGNELSDFDRDTERVAVLLANGVKACASAAEVHAQSDVVIVRQNSAKVDQSDLVRPWFQGCPYTAGAALEKVSGFK